jgi:hypothetical protein
MTSFRLEVVELKHDGIGLSAVSAGVSLEEIDQVQRALTHEPLL